MRIEDYALIGDMQTAALVGRNGSIDWCCFPRFDSGACFARLLGGAEDGYWEIAPASGITSCTRRYRHDTLILESVVECAEGRLRMIDFMPPRGTAPDIVRIVEGLDGEVPMCSQLQIRFDYGSVVPWVRRVDHARVAVAGPDALCFRTPAHTEGREFSTISEFTLKVGERVPFVLTWYPSNEHPPKPIDPEQALTDTEQFWLEWASRCTHGGDYHDEVHQSLMVLKALTYTPTAGIVAAPTTSLPEQIGGARNWDYRYCWLRDATLTLRAMLNAGYRDEAHGWRNWLLRAIAGDPADIQILYGVAGERRLFERELDWLDGYEGSRPVRTGNGAYGQLQLDVFGDLIDSGYQTRVHGIDADANSWSLARMLLAWLEDGWRQKDSGIWEVRGPTRHFTHSKVMCWVAFDRAVRQHEEFGQGGPVERWRELRDEIHAQVLEHGWSQERGAFVQSYGSSDLDATALLMPAVGFLPHDDERIVATVEAIRRDLTEDGLVLRYRPRDDGAVDGLSGSEGVFLPCSFWLADALAGQGRHDEARELFERLLDLRNDVGLLSEEYDPSSGRMLGNFPQAFTHLAVVNTAMVLGHGVHLQSGEAQEQSG
jgi:GH15 family glucan-1,4-alpha-glucosidase